MLLKKVTSTTRAGNGRTIICPNCGQAARVGHFSWSALTCSSCQISSDKEKWYYIDLRGKETPPPKVKYVSGRNVIHLARIKTVNSNVQHLRESKNLLVNLHNVKYLNRFEDKVIKKDVTEIQFMDGTQLETFDTPLQISNNIVTIGD